VSEQAEPRVIRISAALISDPDGRLLLVRKTGTTKFMQAGGKIESGESPAEALARELGEEVGLVVLPDQLNYVGHFVADAANEVDHTVDAFVFSLTVTETVAAAAEIAEMVWVTVDEARALPLAPLTRDFMLDLIPAARHQ
jgi:8-oxo-dGTP pyrophosphatase MutT (NUDIX family)